MTVLASTYFHSSARAARHPFKAAPFATASASSCALTPLIVFNQFMTWPSGTTSVSMRVRPVHESTTDRRASSLAPVMIFTISQSMATILHFGLCGSRGGVVSKSIKRGSGGGIMLGIVGSCNCDEPAAKSWQGTSCFIYEECVEVMGNFVVTVLLPGLLVFRICALCPAMKGC
jgi:hypothetical protein